MKRVLVTGASGFVGTAMCARLAAAGASVVAAVRRESRLPHGVSQAVTGEIDGTTSWSAALPHVTTVVHLAARVHVMRDDSGHALERFRQVNVEGTAALARQAAAAGVLRFVFVSSVKVNGERRERPYSERDTPAPQGAYAQSKYEAEQRLRELEKDTGMAVTIVRPPLVYGPGVQANFLKLMDAAHRGVPLPLGAVRNRLSLIYVGNLVDALARCLDHPRAAGQTYLVSDGEDISTPELLTRIAKAMGVRLRLVPVPPFLLRVGAGLVGKSDVADRLIDSLTIDSQAIRSQLEWTPPVTLQEGLAVTVADYLNSHGR